MSNVLYQVNRRPLAHMVKAEGKIYYVDSCFLVDRWCYETAIYEVGERMKIGKEIKQKHFGMNKPEMEKYHKKVCLDIKEVLNE